MKKVLALLMVIGIFGAFMAGCSKPAEEGGATAGAGADATKPATEGEAGK